MPRRRTSGSQRRERRYPQPVPAAFRPERVPPRPLAGLAQLLGLRLSGPQAAAVPGQPAGLTGITHDSRAVQNRALYPALPGSPVHGARLAAAAPPPAPAARPPPPPP